MVNFDDGDGSSTVCDVNPSLTSNNNEKDSITIDSNSNTRNLHPQPWCGQHIVASDGSNKNVYKYGSQDDKEKTPMCRIAELARYHKLKHEYKLMDESGPAHKKLFSVQLILNPEQVFDGSGASIKKAQQAAAANALENTTLPQPPDKNGKRKKADPSSPVQLLSHVTRRLNLPEPLYRPHTQQKMPRTRLQLSMTPLPPPPPMQRLMPSPNGRCFGPPSNFPVNGSQTSPVPPPPPPPLLPPTGILPMPPFGGHHPSQFGPFPSPDRMCMVSVALGPYKVFTGCAPTFAQAKVEAAVQALSYLGPAIQQLDARLKEEELKKSKSTDETISALSKLNCDEKKVESVYSLSPADIPKHRQKSVISQVHECALQMKLNVEFEVLLEDGPPHERTYQVKCSLKDVNDVVVIEGTGDGRKKKEATQAACCSVLAKLEGIENSPIFLASNLLKLQKKSTTHSKEPKRKTIIKDMKMDPSYGHQINPVSRLIQVLQARSEADPQFSLVGEHGQSRYKEFVVEVACGERSCTGAGPNKRLAKRAAAEAMLAQIGFVKPLPPPGKSLLKRKEPQMKIGVFDPNDLIEPPSLPPSTVIVPAEDSSKPDDSEFNSAPDQSITQVGESSDEKTNDNWTGAPLEGSCPSGPRSDAVGSGTSSPNEGASVPPSPASRRRVTFNSQVEACPPPDDVNYPQAEVAPLKADVVVEGRLKRMRKSKDGKRSLTEEQKSELVESAKEFVHNFCVNRVATFSSSEGAETNSEEIDSSKSKLASFSEKFKFSVQYTNFPKSPDGSDQLYFALVSLGLDRPMVCHGSGQTVESAADNAAYNAICSLAKLLEAAVVSPVPAASPT